MVRKLTLLSLAVTVTVLTTAGPALAGQTWT